MIKVLVMESLCTFETAALYRALLLSVVLEAANQIAFAKSDNKDPSNIKVTNFKLREKPKHSLVPAAGNSVLTFE